jgi:aspartate/methionine/tyrosine aminotransferase
MKYFQPFLLERLMSAYEQDVEINLSESGVHPMTLAELTGGDASELLNTELNYPHVNGEPALRENIAALYEGAGPENVLVTVGAIEANYLTVNTLLSEGDKIAVMVPNYAQIWGIAKNLGLNVREFNLNPDNGWSPDLDQLESAAGGAKLITVCNPNNPTGKALTENEMDSIVRIAKDAGAWILSDEVYSGAERVSEEQTPSFYGRYDKVIAIGSMSKAYGLPGLRLGWAVAPEGLIDEIWARHEYIAISASMLSNKLATIALSGEKRPLIIERTRGLIRRGFPILEEWVRENADLVSMIPPDAAAIAFLRYSADIGSEKLVDLIRQDKSVLIAPGAHFGLERHVRISFGLPETYLTEGLSRIGEVLEGFKTNA